MKSNPEPKNTVARILNVATLLAFLATFGIAIIPPIALVATIEIAILRLPCFFGLTFLYLAVYTLLGIRIDRYFSELA